jgi:hypothetical protein
MLLFVPLVSYGSDEAPTENSNVVLMDSYDNVDVVAVVVTPTLKIGDSYNLSKDYGSYTTVTIIGLHSKSAIDATVLALSNRARWLVDTNKSNWKHTNATNPGKIRKNPSNHVGKLIHRTTNK